MQVLLYKSFPKVRKQFRHMTESEIPADYYDDMDNWLQSTFNCKLLRRSMRDPVTRGPYSSWQLYFENDEDATMFALTWA